MIVSIALLLRALALITVGTIAAGAYNLYQKRMRFRSLTTKYGIPILPHNFLLGHLMIAAKVVMKYPEDVAVALIPYLIAVENPEITKNGYWYLDMWPVADQMMVVHHPDLMAQFTQDPSFPKHTQMEWEFGAFSHGVDLVTSNGQLWKTWRSIFSPGFSSKNIQTYIPAMLEEFNVFRSKMAGLAATGEAFNADKYTMALTVDIIGHAVLGARLHAQTTGCEIFDALKRQIALLVVDYSPRGLAKLWHPLRSIRIWNNNRVMRNGVLPYILNGIRDSDRKEGSNKTMHSLAVKSYLTEHSAEEGSIDADWINIAVAQFKMLLFAGHDTVSSTFCFVAALLHQHPDKLAKCREELDAVLGPFPTNPHDVDPAQQLLADAPETLNRLVYLTACIKETLRLFGPVSGSVRQAPLPNQHITNPTATTSSSSSNQTDKNPTTLPVWDLMLFSHQAHLHRDPTWWPHPHTFIPERFTSSPGDELYPRHKHAWRPFEMGQRNCIGQEFAMVELRLVLALGLREWDFVPVIRAGDGGEAGKGGEGGGKTYFGSTIWQTTPGEEITMHPRDGMVMRVRRRGTG